MILLNEEKNRLLLKVKEYNPKFDQAIISKALDYLFFYHRDQYRKSGEPFYTHPLAVGHMMADMKLDTETIVASLLHDTVEDTELTIEEIRNNFGNIVGDLVEGVTKLKTIRTNKAQAEQAENFRNLFISMSKDIRALLIKIVDRLHNMRTIGSLGIEKQNRIALETIEIYAPLAERIGMQKIKSELYDRSLSILYPEPYKNLLKRIEEIIQDNSTYLTIITEELELLLKKGGLKAKVLGRQKTTYSIWNKMVTKKLEFQEIKDIIGFRVIVNSLEECYQALGILHSKYKSISADFEDLISNPKPNGYQSLHTTLLGSGNNMEIQIRTAEMEKIAEFGIAAHWAYKQNYYSSNVIKYNWVGEILRVVENYETNGGQNLLQNTKLCMYYDQIFCFSTHGDIIALPKDATPIDFAYAMNEELGMRFVAVKVNGYNSPINTKLKNGDVIDILTDSNSVPIIEWINFAVTAKAKTAIAKFTEQTKKMQYILLGQRIIDSIFNTKFLADNKRELIKLMTSEFKYQNIEQFFCALGQWNLKIKDIYMFLEKNIFVKKFSFNHLCYKLYKYRNTPLVLEDLILGIAVYAPPCCFTAKKHKIFGIMEENKGLVVHSFYCTNITAGQKYNFLRVIWNIESRCVIEKLEIILKGTSTLYSSLINYIFELKQVGIESLKLRRFYNDVYKLYLSLEVNDSQEVEHLIRNLSKHEEVFSIKHRKNKWRIWNFI